MLKIFFFAFLSSSLISFGQTFPRTEIAAGLTTHDNSIAIGNGHFTDSLQIVNNWNAISKYSSAGIGIHLNLKFYRSINAAYRVKVTYMSKNIKSNQTEYGPYFNTESSIKQQIIRIAPGFQWGFQQGPVEFFGGIELPLTYIGNSTYESITETEFYTINSTSHVTGGIGIASGLFLGSTFHANKFLVFGFELNGNYGFTKLGGTYSSVYKTTSGGSTSAIYSATEEVIKQIGFSSLQANLSIGINF